MRSFVGWQPRDVLTLQDDLSALRLQKAGDGLEDRTLAGAVGPDDPEDGAAADLEAQIADGEEPSESNRQTADFKRRYLRSCDLGRRPWHCIWFEPGMRGGLAHALTFSVLRKTARRRSRRLRRSAVGP